MDKTRDIYEALNYLKEGELLTSDGKDNFVFKKERIHVYQDGTHFTLSEEDFIELYGRKPFFIYEENVEIDEEKDETYYRYYRK